MGKREGKVAAITGAGGGSLLLCDLNLQTQIRLTCVPGAKNLGQLSVNCCRVPTMTRYKLASLNSFGSGDKVCVR